ncbi:ty3-gypsy retrotransposon protein [Tanacetum coccineum]
MEFLEERAQIDFGPSNVMRTLQGSRLFPSCVQQQALAAYRATSWWSINSRAVSAHEVVLGADKAECWEGDGDTGKMLDAGYRMRKRAVEVGNISILNSCDWATKRVPFSSTLGKDNCASAIEVGTTDYVNATEHASAVSVIGAVLDSKNESVTGLFAILAHYSTQAPGGYLQPLPTPMAVWEDVSMDFITGLPNSKGVTVIFVVVDHFKKYAHFGMLPTNFNAHKVAEVFLEIVIKHHGLPKTIVSDRDPIFVSKFWNQLFLLSGTHLNHSTAYHPQTNGQTEVVNRGLEQYLRAMALYGRLPLTVIPYPPGTSKVAAVDELLVERDELLRQLKENLLATKHRMEIKANRKRREVEFKVGDMVLVKLQPYRQLTLAKRLSNKLAKLKDPVPVFHVSILKGFLGDGSEVVAGLPEEFHEGQPVEQPLAVCDMSSCFTWFLHWDLGYDTVTIFAETGDANASKSSATQSTTIEGDVSYSQKLTTILLNEFNYLPWSRAITIALDGRSRLGFISGKNTNPGVTSPEYEACYSESSKDLWEAVQDMYGNQNNSARIFQIQLDIANLRQDGNSFVNLLGKLKGLWNELEVYRQFTQKT